MVSKSGTTAQKRKSSTRAFYDLLEKTERAMTCTHVSNGQKDKGILH